MLSLDSLFSDKVRNVSQGMQVMTLGSDILSGGTGTTSEREYAIEVEGTRVSLRAYEVGEYSYVMYGQDIGAEPKPLRTLIDTLEARYGGGRDEDVPLAYFVGLADYSVGSWRWFGPFTDVDVLIQVRSETLKTRFKSFGNRYYITVLAVNEGSARMTSAMTPDGIVAEFSIVPKSGSLLRRVFQAEEDPGGVTVEAVITDVAIGIEPSPRLLPACWLARILRACLSLGITTLTLTHFSIKFCGQTQIQRIRRHFLLESMRRL